MKKQIISAALAFILILSCVGTVDVAGAAENKPHYFALELERVLAIPEYDKSVMLMDVDNDGELEMVIGFAEAYGYGTVGEYAIFDIANGKGSECFMWGDHINGEPYLTEKGYLVSYYSEIAQIYTIYDPINGNNLPGEFGWAGSVIISEYGKLYGYPDPIHNPAIRWSCKDINGERDITQAEYNALCEKYGVFTKKFTLPVSQEESNRYIETIRAMTADSNRNVTQPTPSTAILTADDAELLINRHFESTLDAGGDIIAITAQERRVINESSVSFTLRAQTKSAEWTQTANILIGDITVDLATGKAVIEYSGGNTETVDLLSNKQPSNTVPNPHSDWASEVLERAFNLDLVPPLLISHDVDLREPITRVEFAGIVVKAYEALAGTNVSPATSNPFSDTKDVYALMAYSSGLMVGISNTEFSPNMILNRETAATALARVYKRWYFPGWSFSTDANYTLNYSKPASFADDADISDWARDSVYFMAANRIVLGIGENRFAPRNMTPYDEAVGLANATREQALIIALRMVENY